MKDITNLPTVSSRKFGVDKSNKFLHADASDLMGNRFHLGRVYPDACDLGFRLVNAKTGNATDWVLESTNIVDGDELDWSFVPTARSVRDNPSVRGWRIFIHND